MRTSRNITTAFNTICAASLLFAFPVTARQMDHQEIEVAPGEEKTVGFAAKDPGIAYQLDVKAAGHHKFKTAIGDGILGENRDSTYWQLDVDTDKLKTCKVLCQGIHDGHEAVFRMKFKQPEAAGGGGRRTSLDDAHVKAVNCFVKIHKPGTISTPGALIPAPTQIGKPYTGILQPNTDDEISPNVEDWTTGSKTGAGMTADNDLVKVELSWNPTPLRPDMVDGKTLTLTLPPGAKAYRADGSLLTQFSVTIGSGGSGQLSQLASARKQNIFLEGNGTWTGGEVILKVDGLDPAGAQGGAQGKANLVPVIFVTPAGDPVTSPVAVNHADGQNEFTYDDQSPGVLAITLKASVQNYDNLPDDIKNGLVFDFKKDASNQIIGTSSFAWEPGYSGGKPVVSGSELVAVGKFTTLPDRYDAFGKKWAPIKLGGIEIAREDFEVFYMAEKKNHFDMADHPDWPNWFVYYRQNEGGTDYGHSDTNATSETDPVTQAITIENNAYRGGTYIETSIVAGMLKGSGLSATTYKRYQYFYGVVNHERQHRDGQLRPSDWGPPLDDDSDRLSDTFEANTSHTDPNVADSAQAGTPDREVYAGGPIEEAAINSADSKNDWANPGFNNKTK